MPQELSPIQSLRSAQRKGELDPIANLRAALKNANGNASRNTYITLDPAWSIAEAERKIAEADRQTAGAERQTEGFAGSADQAPLFGIPVSLKDCFDLQGFNTSIGSKFYARHNGIAAQDSAIAARLKAAGAFITGKTHLHQLAYGITGQNRDYGDCLQPADSTRLTGGSSSGAAASVQEGSAIAAIGTDTGGSVRLPAAICGLSGYRSSLGVADWRGGGHLAQSFDTVGWLFRDLRDAPVLAGSIFDLPPVPEGAAPLDSSTPGTNGSAVKIGVLAGPLLEDCDAPVNRSFAFWQDRLRQAGAHLQEFNPEFWLEARDIFAPIQAWEAAKLHAGFYDQFEPAIAERLRLGAAIPDQEVVSLRQRRVVFCDQMAEIFRRFDLLLAPATSVSRIDPSQDQSTVRANILRFTTPASLAGLPAVVLPSPDCGLQLLAAHNDDRRLLHYAAQLGEQLAG